MFTLTTHTQAISGQQQSTSQVKTWLARTLVILPLTLVALCQPLTVNAAAATATPAQAASSCVLVCNAKTHRCSRYPANKVPAGYLVQNGVPPGYKLIKGKTACDSKMCSTKSKSICSTSPIGRTSTSSEN